MIRGEIVSILEWEDRFELGVARLDEHHKRLVALLNEISESTFNGAHEESVGAILVELIDYANYHFSAEESMMSGAGYPDLQSHREEHKTFCHMVVAFRDDINAGKNDFSLDLLSFLGNWLFDHILKTDFLFCQFIEQVKNQAASGR